MSRILRYEVPVDDQVHRLVLPVRPTSALLVAARQHNVVEFWVEEKEPRWRVAFGADLLVVGTGHEYDPGWEPVGTCMTEIQTHSGPLARGGHEHTSPGILVWTLLWRPMS